MSASKRIKISDQPSSYWVSYFQANAKRLIRIPWDHSYQLTLEERAAVMDSIRMFELGEKSAGKTFLRMAKQYSALYDPDYIHAVELFIKEEQRHSSTLNIFLVCSAEAIYTTHWVNSVFRRLRQSIDVESEVMVLISAENIAMIYYMALRQATKSPVLQTICEQILRDESQHLNFQAAALGNIRRTKHPLRRMLFSLAHPVLLFMTSMVVWLHHQRVFRKSGYTMGSFLRELFLVFHKIQLVVRGKA